MKDEIIRFLLANGFTEMETDSYANDFCNVVFEGEGITIADNSGFQRFVDESLYSVIGLLVYHSWISRSFTF